jgi:hypothetical protein
MTSSFSRTVTFVGLALAAACAAAPGGSASADEVPVQTTASAVLDPEAAAITPAQFVAQFGQPDPVIGTASLDCGLGEVRLFAGLVPTNFIPADGRLLPIAENAALFVSFGTAYGGDGRTTFGVPNLKAVTPNHLAYGVCASGTFLGNR